MYKVRAMPYDLKKNGSRDGPIQRGRDAVMAHTVNTKWFTTWQLTIAIAVALLWKMKLSLIVVLAVELDQDCE